jgi:hypothetical protein
MPKIESKCGLMKDILLLLFGGIVGISGSIITTSINNSHEEKMQNSRNAFSFIEEYNKNYLGIINCKKEIIDTAKTLGRNLNIEVNSKDASKSLANYYQTFDRCNSDLLKMKLISTAIGFDTSGVDCALEHLSTLNNQIIITREMMVYENSQVDFHSKLDYKLQQFPFVWSKCLTQINNELFTFSKNFLHK